MAATEGKKTDRRVLRTQAAIREAFLHLILKDDYKKITITSLAREANIDRKTFYTHYSSIEDLLEDVVSTLVRESTERIAPSELLGNPAQFTRGLLTSFEESLPFSVEERRVVFDHLPLNQLLKCWTSATKEMLGEQGAPLQSARQPYLDVMLNFYLGGIFHAYIQWLQSDSPLEPEEVIDFISEGVSNGLVGLARRRIALL